MAGFNEGSARRWRNLAAAGIAALLLGSCGGGGSSSAGGGGTTPAPDEPLVAADVPALVFKASFTVPDGDNTGIERVVLVVPSTGEQQVLDVDFDTDASRTSINPFSFDGRLFILRNSRDSSGFSPSEWNEIDLDQPVSRDVNGEVTDAIPIAASLATNEGNTNQGCLAVLDQTLYWRSPEAGGGLRSADLDSPGRVDGSLLIANTNPNVCFRQLVSQSSAGGIASVVAGMDAAEGVWYDALFDPDTGAMEFYSRNPTTGTPSLLGSHTPADHAQYNRAYSIAFDDGKAYWARVNATTQVVQIWATDFTTTTASVLSFDVPGITVDVVFELDVERNLGVLLVGSSFADTNNLIMFDLDTDSVQRFDLEAAVPPQGGVIGPSFSDINLLVPLP